MISRARRRNRFDSHLKKNLICIQKNMYIHPDDPRYDMKMQHYRAHSSPRVKAEVVAKQVKVTVMKTPILVKSVLITLVMVNLMLLVILYSTLS